MRKISYIFIFSVLVFKTQAQFGDGSQEEANPCGAIDNTLQINKKPMFGAYTREADVAWEKRVWREMDLREKINHPLYYPIDNQPCRISLIQLISKHILKGDIIAFADESFYNPLSLTAVRNKLVETIETTEIIYEPDGTEKEVPIVASDSTSIFTKVIKVRCVEDWYLNKERSALEVRITGIAFYEYVEEKEAYKELFWVYFPAAKKYLAKYRVFNPKNISDYSTFDDVFQRREFGSYIVKESNVYDRYVFDYAKGVDALLESDRIKNDIFRWEHDLWHY
ncbi:MAG: gliding motility protein GldN [Bacteroidia bacterium]|nr:gliding motility protein GldN [Bacteroidia bacterium]